MASIIMIICGVAIAGVWTADIIRGEKVNTKNGLLKARDPESNDLMWPHWIAEYSTAFCLIIAGIGLLLHESWAFNLSLIALGALAYTAMNSLSWALAKRERFNYAIPMIISLAGACLSIIILLK